MEAMEICITLLEDILEKYRAGEYDTRDAACECGKQAHNNTANYCVECGREIKG